MKIMNKNNCKNKYHCENKCAQCVSGNFVNFADSVFDDYMIRSTEGKRGVFVHSVRMRAVAKLTEELQLYFV